MRPMTETETAVIIATVLLVVGLIVAVIVKDVLLTPNSVIAR
jgi:hypothetical protein